MKRYVLTAFTNGFVTMGVEILASRLMAPLVGSSVYMWTSVIGVVLLGIAGGNYAGGRVIDKNPNAKVMVWMIGSAAVCIALMPLLALIAGKIILIELPLIFKIFFIAFIIFFPASFFLGTLYPILIKFFIERVDHTGYRAGILSSSGAFGGIIGTFTIGFFAIGFLGTAYSLFVLALILLFTTAWFSKFSRNSIVELLILSGAFVIIIASGILYRHRDSTVLFEKDSNYYKIKVVDRDFTGSPARMIFLDFDVHSIERLDGKKVGTYQDISPIFTFLKKDFKNILVIGGGSYNIPKDLFSLFKAAITVVEIDPEVTRAAQNFFKIKDYPIQTVNTDGRLFLSEHNNTYDLIFEDAASSFISAPWYIFTKESHVIANKHLNVDGVYALSIISSVEGDGSRTYISTAKTFSQVFPNYVVLYLGANQAQVQNIILIGLKSEKEINQSDLKEAINSLSTKYGVPLHPTYAYKPKFSDETLIFRDDFAPLERFNLRNINNYFSTYALWYYTIFD